MSAEASSSKIGAGVIFKKKRGPAGRSAVGGSSAATSNGAEQPSSSSLNQSGPSRASSRPSGIQSKRQNDSESDKDDSDDKVSASVVVTKKKKRRNDHNPLLQSTGSSYKKLRRADDAEGDDDSGDDDFEGGIGLGSSTHVPSKSRSDTFGEFGVSSIHKSSVGGSTTSSSSINRNQQDATKHSDWDLEVGQHDSARKAADFKSGEPVSNSDGNYHGAKGYGSYIKVRDDGSSAKFKARGPIKAQTTVRSVTLMDYQPDICKDYKETGYCGFGDTCKFLHDRSDYLAGWQLDTVLSNSNKRRREDVLSDPEDSASQDEDAEEEEIPFACLICRQPFTDPIITKCGHYFCSSCAIKRYSKTPKCFACGAQTAGLFNSATKIIQKMQLAKQKKLTARVEKRTQLCLDQKSGNYANQLLDGVEVGNGTDSE